MGNSVCNSLTQPPPSAHPPSPALQPFCLEIWLYGLTSFVLMTIISCHNFSLTENLTGR